ncbi:MAG: TVP38/TMEM64 family protein [bacterium]|nr:TVP38/TMEM64 family protein [bacterium]
MTEQNRPDGALARRRRIFWVVLALAALAGLLALYFRQDISGWIGALQKLQAQKDHFRDWINSFGVWGPVVFIAVQVGQVVFSPIPGELTGFLGGYVYGVGAATFYSTIGLTIGSYMAFAIGRWLGRPFVERLMTRKVIDKFDFLVQHKGALLAFVFFSIPGFPKDYMCYLLGLSPLRLRTFLIVAFFGRIPGTFVLGLQGANLYEERYGMLLGIFLVLLVGAALIAYLKDYIHEWMRKKASDKP